MASFVVVFPADPVTPMTVLPHNLRTPRPSACNATSGWCAYSDPRTVDIRTFTLNDAGVAGSSHGLQDITSTGYTPMRLREYKITLTAHLRNDSSVSQTLSFNVKTRANCLRELVSNCDAVPGT